LSEFDGFRHNARASASESFALEVGKVATALGALASFVVSAGILLSLLDRVCEKDVFKGFYEKTKSLTNSNVVRIGIIYDDDQISAYRDEDFKKLGVDAEGITREAEVTYPVLLEAAVRARGGIGLIRVDIDRDEKSALNWTQVIE